jgi:hypothetical protein
VAAIGRRVITFCKHEAGLRQQLALYHVYHNFCLPHASLRVPLPQPEPTHGGGSEGVAPLFTGHGRGTDRPRVDVAPDAPVSGAAMVPAARTVSY